MSDPSPTPARPLPSSTTLMIRDGAAGLEVFMVMRHRQVDFAASALVFPGGKVDAGDSAPEVLARARRRLPAPVTDEEIPYRVAAIREAFEECGLLLCRPHGQDALVDAARAEALGPKYRRPLDRREISFAAFVEAEQLDPACDLMVPFAHWITPVMMPKRFDTRFYLAAAPGDQMALHDGREAVDSLWADPRQLAEDARRGKASIVFATLMQLDKLGRAGTVAEALALAAAQPVVTVCPEFSQTPKGPLLRIPREAGYGIEEMIVTDLARP